KLEFDETDSIGFTAVMLTIRMPDKSLLESTLRKQSTQQFSYDEVGLSEREETPTLSAYHIDRPQLVLGSGPSTFESAVEAMKSWQHFAVPNAKLFPSSPTIEKGTNLLVYAHHYGIWSTNACRIVYVVDEINAPTQRFGYGYGTLPEHVERGEERFMIEMDEATGEVVYKL